ncbi:DUF4158 domain-containing protein [Sutcliffiella horikoshii]|nr:DUF4158 domain-containing protein [Sutcliffiella horikoshii]MCM3619659.1 DUF4158 domain-containing protein [Sutcliffiella horikoshii]MED4016584.1 DUF4158 domain-containing protein [Sutcliffiella cohnii]
MFLIRMTLEEMRKRKIILPAMTMIERLVLISMGYKATGKGENI